MALTNLACAFCGGIMGGMFVCIYFIKDFTAFAKDQMYEQELHHHNLLKTLETTIRRMQVKHD